MKKQIHRTVLSFILCLSLLLSMTIITSADERTNQVMEYQVDDYTTVRTLKRDVSTTSQTAYSMANEGYNANLYSELIELGIDETVIALASDEEMNIFATSPYIVTSTTYNRIDSDGNSVKVTEKEALSAAEYSDANISTFATSSKTTSYLKLTLSAYVISTEDGTMYYTATANWLTMPVYRGYDSLGMCAYDTSYTTSTASGYYSYKMEEYKNGVLTNSKTHEQSKTSISSSNIFDATKDGCAGMVAVFQLPVGANTSGGGQSYKLTYDDFVAHFSYYGHVHQYETACYFNVFGSYYHTTLSFTGSIGIGLSTSGATPSIGINTTTSVTKTEVPALEIQYDP